MADADIKVKITADSSQLKDELKLIDRELKGLGNIDISDTRESPTDIPRDDTVTNENSSNEESKKRLRDRISRLTLIELREIKKELRILNSGSLTGNKGVPPSVNGDNGGVPPVPPPPTSGDNGDTPPPSSSDDSEDSKKRDSNKAIVDALGKLTAIYSLIVQARAWANASQDRMRMAYRTYGTTGAFGTDFIKAGRFASEQGKPFAYDYKTVMSATSSNLSSAGYSNFENLKTDIDALLKTSRAWNIDPTTLARASGTMTAAGTFRHGEQQKFANMIGQAIVDTNMIGREGESLQVYEAMFSQLAQRSNTVSPEAYLGLTSFYESIVKNNPHLAGTRGAQSASSIADMFASNNSSMMYLAGMGTRYYGPKGYWDLMKTSEQQPAQFMQEIVKTGLLDEMRAINPYALNLMLHKQLGSVAKTENFLTVYDDFKSGKISEDTLKERINALEGEPETGEKDNKGIGDIEATTERLNNYLESIIKHLDEFDVALQTTKDNIGDFFNNKAIDPLARIYNNLGDTGRTIVTGGLTLATALLGGGLLRGVGTILSRGILSGGLLGRIGSIGSGALGGLRRIGGSTLIKGGAVLGGLYTAYDTASTYRDEGEFGARSKSALIHGIASTGGGVIGAGAGLALGGGFLSPVLGTVGAVGGDFIADLIDEHILGISNADKFTPSKKEKNISKKDEEENETAVLGTSMVLDNSDTKPPVSKLKSEDKENLDKLPRSIDSEVEATIENTEAIKENTRQLQLGHVPGGVEDSYRRQYEEEKRKNDFLKMTKPNGLFNNFSGGSIGSARSQGVFNIPKDYTARGSKIPESQMGDFRKWANDISGGVMSDEVFNLLVKHSQEMGVDPRLAIAIATAESEGDQNVVSPVGAIGVMQLMPDTAAGLGVDPHDTEQNIIGGIKYIKKQLDTFGDVEQAAAAYNAGPGAVKQYGGIPPYSETENYVSTIEDYLSKAPEIKSQSNNVGFGSGEGKTWIKTNENVDLSKLTPDYMTSLDIMGSWYQMKTGNRKLVINAGSNGTSHAQGMYSHYTGHKVDIVDVGGGEGDWNSDNPLITRDGNLTQLGLEYIQFCQSMGIACNFEGEGTQNAHFDLNFANYEGSQWQTDPRLNPGGQSNYGGVNNEIGNRILQSMKQTGNTPSHATGLDNVPFDGYNAILHKDERVLTKAENAKFKNLLGFVPPLEYKINDNDSLMTKYNKHLKQEEIKYESAMTDSSDSISPRPLIKEYFNGGVVSEDVSTNLQDTLKSRRVGQVLKYRKQVESSPNSEISIQEKPDGTTVKKVKGKTKNSSISSELDKYMRKLDYKVEEEPKDPFDTKDPFNIEDTFEEYNAKVNKPQEIVSKQRTPEESYDWLKRHFPDAVNPNPTFPKDKTPRARTPKTRIPKATPNSTTSNSSIITTPPFITDSMYQNIDDTQPILRILNTLSNSHGFLFGKRHEGLAKVSRFSSIARNILEGFNNVNMSRPSIFDTIIPNIFGSRNRGYSVYPNIPTTTPPFISDSMKPRFPNIPTTTPPFISDSMKPIQKESDLDISNSSIPNTIMSSMKNTNVISPDSNNETVNTVENNNDINLNLNLNISGKIEGMNETNQNLITNAIVNQVQQANWLTTLGKSFTQRQKW